MNEFQNEQIHETLALASKQLEDSLEVQPREAAAQEEEAARHTSNEFQRVMVLSEFDRMAGNQGLKKSDTADEYRKAVTEHLTRLAEAGASYEHIREANWQLHCVVWDQPEKAAIFNSSDQKSILKAARVASQNTSGRTKHFSRSQLQDLYRDVFSMGDWRNVSTKAFVSLVIATAISSNTLRSLKVGDVSRAHTHDGLNIRIGSDSDGVPRIIPIARAENALLDPVLAIERWLAMRKSLGETGTLQSEELLFFKSFKTMRKFKDEPAAFTNILRWALERGTTTVDFGEYSFYSLRNTYSHLNYQSGTSQETINAWKGTFAGGNRGFRAATLKDLIRIEETAQGDYLDNKWYDVD